MTKLGIYGENAISILKYVIAVATILGGIGTALSAPAPMHGPLGFLYGTQAGLTLFGLLVVACGLSLLYGKVRRSKHWTGIGLMACYLCFVFAALIQIAAFGVDPGYWLGNAIFAAITGALWLRWKFKTQYINPNHFKKEIRQLNQHK